MDLELFYSADRRRQQLAICVLVVGIHSLLLGAFIFFFTEVFYTFFFGVAVENFFFVQQAGVFLFCLGLFYLAPLTSLGKHHSMVDIIIMTKLLAVLFLIQKTRLVPKPEVILLAAAADAIMAALLIFFSLRAGLLLKDRHKPSR